MAETIFALATPPGRSGVAVIRVSGPHAFAAAEALGVGRPKERLAALRRLRHPLDGRPLDDALVLLFQGPRSFTGEDVVELHLHGGPAVCRSVAGALACQPGLREAEAGEFTRRALMNGKLDLAQAEGLGDLLAAETAAQAQRALALADGALSQRAAAWRATLVRALALVEACIDFADEDLPAGVTAEACTLLREMATAFEMELAGSAAAERLREGFEVALVGAPNVGKSTLLNALAGRDAALTSEIAGTTRDVIEVRMDLGGLPVSVIDMAGLRATDDPVESLGVDRARRRAAAADLRVFLVEEMGAGELGVEQQTGDVVVLAKGDLRGEADAVSGLTGAGVPKLLERIAAELGRRASTGSLVSRERQRAAVARAVAAVNAAEARLRDVEPEVDLAAADVLEALRALDFLVGKVDVEAVLDVVFRNFCIGK